MAEQTPIAVGRLRLGVLAAARAVPFSILQPIERNSDLRNRIQVVGLAAQTAKEAEDTCKAWKIPKSYASLEELLEDPDIDAVYNVLPAPLRCTWTVRALMAGKHVLSETPVCVNAREAVAIQRAAEDSGLVMLEGCHPMCHPVTKRVQELILDGTVGKVENIELSLPIGHSVAGQLVCKNMGALMGLGIHAVAIIRALAQGEPVVTSATAVMGEEEDTTVDAEIVCELALPHGATAAFECSTATPPNGAKNLPTTYRISGSGGTINVNEWFLGHGQAANEIEVEQYMNDGYKSREYVKNEKPETRDTFYFQLMSFVHEVACQSGLEGSGMPWMYRTANSPTGTVRNMALIDNIAKAASIAPRRSAMPPPGPYENVGRAKL